MGTKQQEEPDGPDTKQQSKTIGLDPTGDDSADPMGMVESGPGGPQTETTVNPKRPKP